VADNGIEGERQAALTRFLETRIGDGYLVETRTDTHAVIAPGRWLSVKQAINPFEKAKGRQVISVDDQGVVTMGPAEPVRF
jgi:hypothetical protein